MKQLGSRYSNLLRPLTATRPAHARPRPRHVFVQLCQHCRVHCCISERVGLHDSSSLEYMTDTFAQENGPYHNCGNREYAQFFCVSVLQSPCGTDLLLKQLSSCMMPFCAWTWKSDMSGGHRRLRASSQGSCTYTTGTCPFYGTSSNLGISAYFRTL